MIENKSNKLIDIQHTFDMEVRNNDFAKHLRKIFKKKLKIPKVKSDDDDDGNIVILIFYLPFLLIWFKLYVLVLDT